MKNPVGWFDIAVKDIDRAEKFYKELLGLECSRQPEVDGMTMSWFPMSMEENAPFAMGSLVLQKNFNPSYGGTVVYFDCKTVEGTLEKASEMNVKIIVPKTSIGEHGFFAQLEDSEGNLIAIHSHKG